jgi:hypothetical protein
VNTQDVNNHRMLILPVPIHAKLSKKIMNRITAPLGTMLRFREGARFAYRPSVALLGSQIVPFDIGGIDLN